MISSEEGSIGVALVTIDLKRRGWHVFVETCPSCSTDLIALRNDDEHEGLLTVRVQVKKGGVFSKLEREQNHVLASVNEIGQVKYMVRKDLKPYFVDALSDKQYNSDSFKWACFYDSDAECTRIQLKDSGHILREFKVPHDGSSAEQNKVYEKTAKIFHQFQNELDTESLPVLFESFLKRYEKEV